MYISVITVLVNDVDRAVDFYTNKLGWDKTMDVPMDENNRWVTVSPTGERTSFTLTKGGPMWSSDKVGGFSGVILEVDDVFATHRELEQRGVTFEDAPSMQPWGGWATFKDSEGNIHGLHSPATGAR